MDQPTPRVGDTFHGMCDGCLYGPVGLTAYLGPTARHSDLRWLCALCARTPAGSRAICYVGNAILAALR
jgi:hypothetical protein